MIADALCHLDCRITHTHRVGDHQLIIGVVEDVVSLDRERTLESETRSPLVYFDRQFWALHSPAPSQPPEQKIDGSRS